MIYGIANGVLYYAKSNKRYIPKFKEIVIRPIQGKGVSYNEANREYGIAHGTIQIAILLRRCTSQTNMQMRKRRLPSSTTKTKEDMATGGCSERRNIDRA